MGDVAHADGGRGTTRTVPVVPRMRQALRGLALGAALLGAWSCARAAPVDTVAPLQALAKAGRHPDLRWPEFPEFRSEVGRLYERANWQPLWLRDARPTEAATRLIARLSAADTLGLDPADYDAAWLERRAASLASPGIAPVADSLARFDVGLSLAAVRFVSALHRGRVSPRVVHAELFIPRSYLAAEMAVDSLRDANRQGSILERLQPRLHHYQLLKNGLARYRELARDSSLIPLVGLPRVARPGTPLHAAARLRKLLVATGDLPATAAPGPAGERLYSADLVAAVKRFQVRQGFVPDGVIGPATAERLSRPFAERVAQIELALERFRWLPLSFPVPPIIVNIPAFRLYAFRGKTDAEDEMLVMDVVVGGAFDRNTPVFAANMRYLVFRPYWDVPVSIMKAELGPRAVREPGYLKDEDMLLVSGEGEKADEVPATRQNLERIGQGVRVRQRPGPKNALGLVKFMLPNAHDVYLHDTPAKGAFARSRRDVSHGCIRLSDPVALAEHVLRDQPEWTTERIRAAMEGEDDRRVELSGPVPVCIVYSTAFARDNGEVNFYLDVYGLDVELTRLLKAGYPYPK
jgi:murein L,D-transpeptidase YcbB/YkuD